MKTMGDHQKNQMNPLRCLQNGLIISMHAFMWKHTHTFGGKNKGCKVIFSVLVTEDFINSFNGLNKHKDILFCWCLPLFCIAMPALCTSWKEDFVLKYLR